MYDDLMIDLDLCARGEKTGYNDVELCGLAYSAIKSLTAQLAALQAENAELREENGCLQHNVAAMEARLDQQAKNCEMLLSEKDREIERLKSELLEAREDYMASEMEREQGLAAITRMEAERDAARQDCAVAEENHCKAVACIQAVEEAVRFQRPSAIVVAISKWRGAQGEG